MGRRTLLLIAAVVLAGLGATLVLFYAHGADQRAAQGQTLRSVLVAKALIPQTGSFSKKDMAGQALVPRPCNSLKTKIRTLWCRFVSPATSAGIASGPRNAKGCTAQPAAVLSWLGSFTKLLSCGIAPLACGPRVLNAKTPVPDERLFYR